MKNMEEKSNNLMIFGLNEPPGASTTSISTADLANIKSILSLIPDIHIDNLFVRRVGKLSSDKPRPICVRMASQDVFTVISNSKLLPQNIKVVINKTKFQVHLSKQLQKQVHLYNASHLTDQLYVKMKKDKPCIFDQQYVIQNT